MTFDDMLDAYAAFDGVPEAAMAAALADWPNHGPQHRALLRGYVTGQDLSERTERALLVAIHLLAQQEDAESFPLLCALAHDPERLGSALDDETLTWSYPAFLISTFDGTLEPLQQVIEGRAADELCRFQAVVVLAYLTRSGRVPQHTTYDYLAALPARLDAEPGASVWFGYAQAVAALGFSGLAAVVDGLFADGSIAADLMTPEDFWLDLRASQQDPKDVSNPIWDGYEPAGDAVTRLQAMLDGVEGQSPIDVPEPIRNPLRNVGRNDPCPCGSGRKYKKCCLAA